MACCVVSCGRVGRVMKKAAVAAARPLDDGAISSFCSSLPFERGLASPPARGNRRIHFTSSKEAVMVVVQQQQQQRRDCCCVGVAGSDVFSTAAAAPPEQQPQQRMRGPRRRRRTTQILLLSVLTFVVCLLWQQQTAAGFQAMLELPGGGKQCIGEQLSKHVLVVGEVHLLHPTPPPPSSGRKMNTPLLVTALDSTSSTPVYKQQGKEHVRTAFTTTTAGTHSFCVQNLGAERMVVDIQILWGPEARDYGQIAKAEHLDEIMLQLMRLQDRLKLYQANVLYMRQNEQRMRDDSDSTASWLMTFCIINVLLLILTALASAYYFKRFFRSKKII